MAAQTIRFAVLGPGDVDAVLALHLAATGAVGRSDLIKPEDRGFFERMLGEEGRVIGAFRARELTGYGVLQVHLPPSEDARPYFGLKPSDPLAKLAGAGVRPDRWGGGLHDEFIARRVAEGARLGITHLYATSAPGNGPSWANLMGGGFAVRALVEKYGGHLRFLLYRRADRTATEGGEAGDWLDAEDVAGQRAALAAGAWGLAWRRRADGGREIRYAKP